MNGMSIVSVFILYDLDKYGMLIKEVKIMQDMQVNY